jgi:hypothetical protein
MLQIVQHGKDIEDFDVRFLDDVVDRQDVVGQEIQVFHFTFFGNGLDVFFYRPCCLCMPRTDGCGQDQDFLLCHA